MTVELSQREYDELMQRALAVSSSSRPAPPPDHGTVTRTVTRTVEVPVEEEVRVPVRRQVRHTETAKKNVETTRMVPKQRMKQVEETVMEVQEFQEKRHKWVWKREKVEYYETVRKSVPVTRVKEVPYTEYVPESTTVEVEVPVDTVKEQRGYRVDKVLRSKAVDVEQDIVYEMKPHRVGMGPPRLRDGDAYVPLADLGTVEVGPEVFNGGDLTPRRRSDHHDGGSVISRRSKASAGAPPPHWYREDDAALGPVYLEPHDAQKMPFEGGASVRDGGSVRDDGSVYGESIAGSQRSQRTARFRSATNAWPSKHSPADDYLRRLRADQGGAGLNGSSPRYWQPPRPPARKPPTTRPATARPTSARSNQSGGGRYHAPTGRYYPSNGDAVR